SGVRTIVLTSTPPTIVEPVTLDGFTQSGSTSNTLAIGNNAIWLVRIDGAGLVDGLRFLSSSNVVRGLIISRFNGDGIELTNGGNNVVVGNCIGLDENGTDQGNNADGVFVINSSANRIGGAAPGDRNVISGNTGDGIEINGLTSSSNLILGNYVGPDPGG